MRKERQLQKLSCQYCPRVNVSLCVLLNKNILVKNILVTSVIVEKNELTIMHMTQHICLDLCEYTYLSTFVDW